MGPGQMDLLMVTLGVSQVVLGDFANEVKS